MYALGNLRGAVGVLPASGQVIQPSPLSFPFSGAVWICICFVLGCSLAAFRQLLRSKNGVEGCIDPQMEFQGGGGLLEAASTFNSLVILVVLSNSSSLF